MAGRSGCSGLPAHHNGTTELYANGGRTRSGVERGRMHRKPMEGAGALPVTRENIGCRRVGLGACVLRATWVVMIAVALVGGPVRAKDHVAPERQEQLVLVGPWPSSDVEVQRLLRVYTEVFRRLELGVRYREVPARRASDLAERGLVDGELSRVYEYGNHFRNLVRVEESHHEKSCAHIVCTGPGWTAGGAWRIFPREWSARAAWWHVWTTCDVTCPRDASMKTIRWSKVCNVCCMGAWTCTST